MPKFKQILIFIVLVSIVVLLESRTQRVDAQVTAPFLSSPYYDTQVITSYFDHNVQYNVFTRYDGSQWNPPTPVDVVNCTTGTNCYDGHDGIDFGGFIPPYGTNYYKPILAAASGYVVRSEWFDLNNRYSGFGLVVEIQHSNGYVTRYGHLSSIAVSQGQFVTVGQRIGSVGSTGISDGVHLHFGVMNASNQLVDPFGWSGNGADPWPYSSTQLWSDGELAGFPIPFPGVTEVVVVDNGDAGFYKYCIYGDYWWDVSGIGNWYDMAYTYVTSYPNCYAQWQRTPSKSGIYDIDVYVPNGHATSWQSDFRINAGYGVQHTKVDQLGSSNKWLSLGTYFLAAGDIQTVWLNDYTGESIYSRKIGVDAIRFNRRNIEFIYLPLVVK